MKKMNVKKELINTTFRLSLIFFGLTLFFTTLFYFIPSKPFCITEKTCLEAKDDLILYATTISASFVIFIITVKLTLFMTLFLLARGLIIYTGLGIFFILGALSLYAYKFILDSSDTNYPAHIPYIAWTLMLIPILILGISYLKNKNKD